MPGYTLVYLPKGEPGDNPQALAARLAGTGSTLPQTETGRAEPDASA